MRYNDYQCRGCNRVRRLPAKTPRKIYACEHCDAIQTFEAVEVTA